MLHRLFRRPADRRLVLLLALVASVSARTPIASAESAQVLAEGPSISSSIVATDPSVQTGATVTWVQPAPAGAHAIFASTKEPNGTWSAGQAIASGAGRFSVSQVASSPVGNVAVVWTVGNALDIAVRRAGIWSAPTMVATLPATPDTPHTFITNLATVDDAGTASVYWSLYDFSRHDQEVQLTTVSSDSANLTVGTGMPATTFVQQPVFTAASAPATALPPAESDALVFGFQSGDDEMVPRATAADGSSAVIYSTVAQVGRQTLFMVKRRTASGIWGTPQPLNGPSPLRFNAAPAIVGATDWYALIRTATGYRLTVAPLPSATSAVKIDVPSRLQFTRAQLKKVPWFPFTAGLSANGYLAIGSFRAAAGAARALKMSKRELACALAYGSTDQAGPGHRAHVYGGVYRYQRCGERLLKRLAARGPSVSFTVSLGGAALGYFVARRTVRIVVAR